MTGHCNIQYSCGNLVDIAILGGNRVEWVGGVGVGGGRKWEGGFRGVSGGGSVNFMTLNCKMGMRE